MTEKYEDQLLKILGSTDRRLQRHFRDFYKKLEVLIDKGYSDRVVMKHLEREVKSLTNALQITTTSAINTAITASMTKNKTMFPRQEFERIAVDLSKDIWKERMNLIEPVRNALKEGLPASELAEKIVADVNTAHKGRGVYREPVKNAMRVARTEITQAYRKNDTKAWDKLDFVIGFEIRLSNSPKKLARCRICRGLKGKYPKAFDWYGWHPNCLCYKIPIQLSDEDYLLWEEGKLKEIPTIEIGEKQRKFVEENRVEFERWKTPPYWLEMFNKLK